MGDSFKYVFIPAALSDPIEQRSMRMVPGKEVECLTDTLKAHFSQVTTPSGAAAAGSGGMMEVPPHSLSFRAPSYLPVAPRSRGPAAAAPPAPCAPPHPAPRCRCRR